MDWEYWKGRLATRGSTQHFSRGRGKAASCIRRRAARRRRRLDRRTRTRTRKSSWPATRLQLHKKRAACPAVALAALPVETARGIW